MWGDFWLVALADNLLDFVPLGDALAQLSLQLGNFDDFEALQALDTLVIVNLGHVRHRLLGHVWLATDLLQKQDLELDQRFKVVEGLPVHVPSRLLSLGSLQL